MSDTLEAGAGARIRARLLRWLPALIWMALIFFTSSQSSLPIDGYPQHDELHRLGHAIAYSTLAVLVRFAVAGWRAPGRLALAISVLYGVSDEIHQTFVPGRTGSPRDVAFDAVWSAAALLAWDWWQRRRGGGKPRNSWG